MSTRNLQIPAVVMALAGKVNGSPIAWKEYPDGWTIVFEDGRKLTFKRTTAPAAPPPPRTDAFGEGRHAGKPGKKGGIRA